MRRDGTLVEVDGRPALRFQRRYSKPIERVWRAVTEADELAQWFPTNVEGERVVGASLRFVDDEQRAAAQAAGEPTRAEGPMFEGSVVAYDPPTLFELVWGTETLRFELEPHGSGTTLVFTHILSHESVAARNGSGWHMCLAALDALLDDDAPAGDEHHWKTVYDDYLDRMGPSLGVAHADGSMTWERSTHVPRERVHAATSDAEEIATWADRAAVGEPLRWQVEERPEDTRYWLTLEKAGDDPELAATWHARLVQLDLYLAAGQVVPVAHDRWIPAYRDRT